MSEVVGVIPRNGLERDVVALAGARWPTVAPMSPDDIARLLVYLGSDESTLMTGQTLYIDGGASLKKYPELFSFFGVG